MKYYIYDFKDSLDNITALIEMGNILTEQIEYRTSMLIIPEMFMLEFVTKYGQEIETSRNYVLSTFDNVGKVYNQIRNREKSEFLTNEKMRLFTVMDIDQIKGINIIESKFQNKK